MSDRISKINELIRKNLSEILLRELSLKSGVFLTMVKIDTTPDLRYTRVFMSVFPEKETKYAETALRKELFKIQQKLNKTLSMKPLPKIEFRIDITESKADVIEKLLKQI